MMNILIVTETLVEGDDRIWSPPRPLPADAARDRKPSRCCGSEHRLRLSPTRRADTPVPAV